MCKAGLTHEDHHFRTNDGRYERSPPKQLKNLYDYLPRDDSQFQTLYHVPQKVSLEGKINSLKQQSHCLGTYVKIDGREVLGSPLFKHATADLVLHKARGIGDEGGDEGWAVSRWATFSVGSKEQRCLQVACSSMPYDSKAADGKWTEWTGRAWVPAESVHLRPTYHGFGLGRGDASVHNFYTASDDVRRKAVSPTKGRGARGRSGSPPKL